MSNAASDKSQREPKKGSSPTATSRLTTNSKHNFLVVDDDPDVLDALRRLFRREYNVFLASSAAEGFEILKDNDIHVVMSDQRMPETSGVEFLSQVKKRFPQVVRILFTGYGDANAVIEAINQGHVYRYIAKPFDPAELKIVVAQAAEYHDILAERERLLDELAERNVQLENRYQELARANDELKTLDRLKTVFMEIVSHELNTPTAIILGYSSLLQRNAPENDPEGAARAVEGIKSSGMRMKRITEKIAKMMAADLTAIELVLEEIDAEELIWDILREIDPAITMRKQEVSVSAPSEPLLFRAERPYIRDVLMNLIVNAIKFSPDEYTIWVTVEQTTLRKKPGLMFSVRDEGVGIRPEDRDRIFTTFFGTFDSRHHSSGDFGFQQRGIGLGLAIVKRFTEMHGGEVEFDSTPEEGSHFRVYLPIEPRTPTAELPSLPISGTPPGTLPAVK